VDDYPHVTNFEDTAIPESPKLNSAEGAADVWDEISSDDSDSTIYESATEEQASSEPVRERASGTRHDSGE